MGVSQIYDPGPVALFLSLLCPLPCEIEYGVTWHSDLEDLAHEDDMDEAMSMELVREVGRRCLKWSEVGRMVPLLTKLRMEERERSRALAEEVEDLRIRNRILMERAGKSMDGDGTCVVL
jgi:hypothetical protein